MIDVAQLSSLYPLSDLISSGDIPLSSYLPAQLFQDVFARLAYADAEATFDGESLTISLLLAFEDELALALPGGLFTLVFGRSEQGWTTFQALIVAGRDPTLILYDASFQLRVSAALLRDVVSDTPAELIVSGDVVITSSGIAIKGYHGVSLAPAYLCGTAVVVSADEVLPAFELPELLAAPTEVNTGIGLRIRRLMATIPTQYFALDSGIPLVLAAREVVIGTDGFSGVLILGSQESGLDDAALALESVEPIDDELGEQSSVPTIDNSLPIADPPSGRCLGLPVSLRHAEIEFRQNAFVALRVGVDVHLDNQMASQPGLTLEIVFLDDDSVAARSTGSVVLGGGIHLQPIGDAPVLVLAKDGDRYRCAVSADFRIPHQQDGASSIQIAGELVIEAAPGDTLRLVSCALRNVDDQLDWELPGNIRLNKVSVAIDYHADERRFATILGGEVLLDDAGRSRLALRAGLAFNNLDDPDDITIDGEVSAANLALLDEIYLFNVTVGMRVQSATAAHAASGALRVAGTAGLFRDNHHAPDASRPAQLSDFVLVVEQLQSALVFGGSGFDIRIDQGRLRLPALFHPAANPGAPATLAINAGQPLRLRQLGGALELSGSLTAANLAIVLPDLADVDGLAINLDAATLSFSGSQLPTLSGATGRVRLPLSGNQPTEISFRDVAWQLGGLPIGQIGLGDGRLAVPLGGGFALELYQPDPHSGGIRFVQEQGRTRLQIGGGVRLIIPAHTLADDQGHPIVIQTDGRLEIAPDALPTLAIQWLAVEGTLRLGGAGGLKIQNARLEARQIAHMLKPSQANPFELRLSGAIHFPQGPVLGLTGARFTFSGGPLPSFDLDGLEIGAGELRDQLQQLPLRVTAAELRFLAQKPLPDRLAPDNIELTLSAELELPAGDLNISARADDLTARIGPNGLPIIELGGVGAGVEDVPLGPLVVTGRVYLSGLNSPRGLFFAGNLGGKLLDAGVVALTAFGPSGPLGACLDVSAGPAGIPLGPTGFLLTGAAGGVSFANSNADPCELRSYIEIGADGLPTSPTRPPDPTRDPAPIGKTVGSGRPAAADSATLVFPCPTLDCPPPSLNILCQPHPDPLLYPGKAIIKFSSLSETFLNQIGITPQFVAGLGLTDPADIARRVAELICDAVGELWPPVPPNLQAQLSAQLDQLQDALERLLANSIGAATGGTSIYHTIRAAAFGGVPCPDVTVRLTGTFSYAGASAFLSITGGYLISSAGSVGILGSVNMAGIPFGQLRGFLTLTDEQGNPSPSVCGDIFATVGPLELGQLRFSYRNDGFLAEVQDAVVGFASRLSAPFVERLIQLIAKEALDDPRYDPNNPAAALGLLSPEQALGVVAHLLSLPPSQEPGEDVLGCVGDLVVATWDSFDPEVLFCGRAAPKLFGLELGGELVGVSARAKKDVVQAEFSFSPSFLIAHFFWTVGTLGLGTNVPIFPALDRASFGFSLALPDPLALLAEGLTGSSRTAAEQADYIARGFAHAIADSGFNIGYELAPFGLKLADAEARVIMPDLANHPARPGSRWLAPEDRRPAAPSRDAALIAALEQDLLGSPLWRGTPEDMAKLTFADGRNIRGLSLRGDYFPHGGIVGAARLPLPRALLDEPPAELLGQIFGGATDIVAWFGAVQHYIDEYILTSDNVGALAFYIPAPNPPSFTVDGKQATPLELMQAIQRLDLDPATIAAGKLYPLSRAFFRGRMRGRLLGIPIAEADVLALPPDRDRPGCFEVRARVPRGSWLGEFVGEASIAFVIRQSPPLPIDEAFATLVATLRQATGPARLPQLVERIRSELDRNLPKVSLEARVDNVRIPTVLAQLLAVQASTTAELFAYSPLYEPAFAGVGPVAEARRNGGIALRMRLSIGAAFGLSLEIPNAEVAVFLGAAGLPAIAARLRVAEAALPGGVLKLRAAELELNSEPRPGQPLLRLAGNLGTQVDLGLAQLRPLRSGSELSGSLVVRPGLAGRPPAVELQLAPAQLTLPLIGATVRFHGAAPDQPFSFSTTGAWSAQATAEGLRLLGPDRRELLRIESQQPLRATVGGVGLQSVTLSFTLPAGVSAVIFPGQSMERRFTSTAAGSPLRLTVASDGRFKLEAELPALDFGVFHIHGAAGRQAPLRAIVGNDRIAVPGGANLTIDGLSEQALVLEAFEIMASGDLDVRVTSGAITAPGVFQLSSGLLRLVRQHGVAQLLLVAPQARLFAGAPYEHSIGLGQLVIASTGVFSYDSGLQTLRVPATAPGQLLFILNGQLEFGNRIAVRGGPPAGPYARITYAQIGAPALGWRAVGQLDVSAARISAALTADPLRFPGLLEIGAQACSLDFVPGQRLRLIVKPPTLTLLGLPSAPPAELTLDVTPSGDYSTAFRTRASLAVLPGVFEIGPGAVTFSGDRTEQSLAIHGAVRTLRTDQASWAFEQTLDLTFTDRPFEIPIPFQAITWFALPGVLRVRTKPSSLRFGRSLDGAFYLALRDLDVALLSNAMELDGRIESDGDLTLRWNAGRRFDLGPFELRSDGPGRIQFNPLEAALKVHIGGGSLHSSIPGWPNSGIGDIPAVDIDSAGDFEIELPVFTFDSILLGKDDHDDFIKLRRAHGKVSLSARSQQDFLGAKLALAFGIDSTGDVSARLTGSLVVGPLDFGSVTLIYNGDNRPFQFRARCALGSLNYELAFGSDGARIVLI